MAGTKAKNLSKTRTASSGKTIGTPLKDARSSLATNGKSGGARNGHMKANMDKVAARKREITLKAFRAAYETHHRKAS
jgi:hypothetical protein